MLTKHDAYCRCRICKPPLVGERRHHGGNRCNHGAVVIRDEPTCEKCGGRLGRPANGDWTCRRCDNEELEKEQSDASKP